MRGLIPVIFLIAMLAPARGGDYYDAAYDSAGTNQQIAGDVTLADDAVFGTSSAAVTGASLSSLATGGHSLGIGVLEDGSPIPGTVGDPALLDQALTLNIGGNLTVTGGEIHIGAGGGVTVGNKLAMDGVGGTIHVAGSLKVNDDEITILGSADSAKPNAIHIGADGVADFATGGLRLNAGSAVDGGGTLKVGSGNGLVLAGGALGSAGGALVVDGTRIGVTGTATTVAGTVTAADAALALGGGFTLAADSTLLVKSVSVSIGAATHTVAGGAGSVLAVTDNADFVSSNGRLNISANLDIKTAASFGKGAAFVATATGNTINLGFGAHFTDEGGDATLTLKGGTLDGRSQTLVVAGRTSGEATLAITDGGSLILGNVDATGVATSVTGSFTVYGGTAGFAVRELKAESGVVTLGNAANADVAARLEAGVGNIDFESGATLAVVSDDATVALSASGRMLNIKKGATLDLGAGHLTVAGGGVQLDGVLKLTGEIDSANALQVGGMTVTSANLGSTFRVELSDALLVAISTVGATPDPALVIGGAITAAGGGSEWRQRYANLFGEYGLYAKLGADVAEGGGMWLRVKSSVDVTRADQVLARLRDMYPDTPMTRGYANITTGVVANYRDWTENGGSGSTVTGGKGVFVDADGSDRARASGYTHYSFLLAAAYNNVADSALQTFAVYDASGKATGATGYVDDAMLALYNGLAGNETVQVALDTALQGMSILGDRVHEIMQRQYECGAVASGSALGSAVMNEQFLNRFWIGGFGQWAYADRRDNYAGYQHTGAGFITGYDRAVGALNVGGAFAYSKGDYKDKSANANDSDIQSYGFHLYANYQHCSGAFLTVSGGYTYSDNELLDSRGGGWAKQDFGADTWNAGLTLGYNWRPAPAFTVTPSIGFVYASAWNEAHTVAWENVLDFHYGKTKLNAAMLPLELRMGYDKRFSEGRRLNLGVKAGYSYNFQGGFPDHSVRYGGLANADPVGLWPEPGAARFTGRHRFNVGAGMRYIAGPFDIGINYDYYARSSFDAHRVTGSVGFSF